jgi:hypothetical protein
MDLFTSGAILGDLDHFPWTDAELRAKVRDAILAMWTVRNAQAHKQLVSGKLDSGARGTATGGRHMDAFAFILADLARAAGFAREEIRFRSGVEIPGFYRPTKQWDVVIIRGERLCAGIELKSMAGSYGNNLNNRSEEALGSAADIWAAFKAGTLGLHQPWLGYLFVIRDEPRSRTPVKIARTPLRTDPIFDGSSYIDRYGILCERMVLERQYSAAAYLSASVDKDGMYAEPRAGLGFDAFARAFFGHLIGCT